MLNIIQAYIRGPITFMKDDPGRQTIGSFTPITEVNWTEQAYIGDTERLCQAIVANDLEGVKHWASQEGHEVNRRDYTGRTPLHLACWCSTAEVVKTLVDLGAKLVPRMVDGRTALHIAAGRGKADIVRVLLSKSEENEALRDERENAKKQAERAAKDEETMRDAPIGNLTLCVQMNGYLIL